MKVEEKIEEKGLDQAPQNAASDQFLYCLLKECYMEKLNKIEKN